MDKGLTTEGRCLCGAVAVHAAVAAARVDACHCSMCRRWGGGPLLAVDAGVSVRLEGEEHIGVFASSDWAERGFCKSCGTHLFYRLKGSEHYMLPAGLVEGELPWSFVEQVFIDDKPGWYAFANETHNLTETEAFEKYGGP